MNGLRPQEMLEVLRALEASAGEGEKAVLATVVSLDGSVYSRAGSMGLFVEDSAGRAGVIAASEGPEALRRELEEAAASGRPRLCALDLAEDEPLLGYGLGDPGRIELFLEPVDARLRLELRAVRDALLKGEGLVWEVEIEGAALGRRGLYSSDHPSAKECYQALSPELVESAEAGVLRRVFLCPVAPMGKVLVFGSGPDAAGLARHLSELGFSVTVADPRAGRLRTPDWDRSRMVLLEGGWEQARSAAQPDEETSIAIMTHSYALDLETLQGALKSPASYVGLIGPAKRSERMLAELAALEVRPRPGVLQAPAGLNIGAESSREQALSVAAEILAARSGRKGDGWQPRAPCGAAPCRKVPG